MKFLLLFGLVAAALFILWSNFARAGEPLKPQALSPLFSLPDQNGRTHNLIDYRGKWVVLYFYPKDDTPGCTQQACAFRDDLAQLKALGAEIIGVSVDDTKSHEEFAKKYHLPFALLSDKGGTVAAQFGALTDLGFMKIAKRHTFLIDPQGRIAKVYVKVETSRHSKEIIEDLKLLTKPI